MDIQRAINQGIEAARHCKSEDADGPYHENHPLFRYWFCALVTKQTCRDFPEGRIAQKVMQENRRK